jgi:hypothetical protein
VDKKTERLVHLADRLVRDIEQDVPPQTEMLQELRALIDQLKPDGHAAPRASR